MYNQDNIMKNNKKLFTSKSSKEVKSDKKSKSSNDPLQQKFKNWFSVKKEKRLTESKEKESKERRKVQIRRDEIKKI